VRIAQVFEGWQIAFNTLVKCPNSFELFSFVTEWLATN